MSSEAQPFVKWVGGKRQVLPEILPRIPSDFGDYWEPFLGGGANFYAIRNLGEKHGYHLSDLNSELINVYQQVKSHPLELVKLLEHHRAMHSQHPPFHHKKGVWKSRPQKQVWYYMVRGENYIHRDKAFTRANQKVLQAARFIYLNRTCFNGLHRVNRQGEFNVPAGRYTDPEIVQAERITACHKAFKGTAFKSCNYAKALRAAKAGDFVYLDPPYDVWDSTSFTSYAKDDFGWQDQEELAQYASQLKQNGVMVMLSNHATPRILKLYKDLGFGAHCFGVKRSVAASAASRSPVSEVLFMGYPHKKQRDPSAARAS